jgi:hypothetical protein
MEPLHGWATSRPSAREKRGTIMAVRTIKRAIAVLLGLVGCAGVPVFNADYDASYWPGETSAAGPNITVLVRGNPSVLPKAEFDRAVTDAMQGWSAYPTHFTTEGNPNAAYRVVMIFNPPATAGGPTLCARPETADGAAGTGTARVPLVAALCRGDYYMSLADGTVAAPGGGPGAPLDGNFRTGIGLVTATLFPAQNPQRLGSHDCGPC